MFKLRFPIALFMYTICLVSFTTADAVAYIGPGAGITAIGSALALVAAVVLAAVGFVWYPVKRLINKLKSSVDKKDKSPK